MYQTGAVDVLTLKELLGHSNVGTTQIYTHLKDAQVRAAVEANPLGTAHHPKPILYQTRPIQPQKQFLTKYLMKQRQQGSGQGSRFPKFFPPWRMISKIQTIGRAISELTVFLSLLYKAKSH